MQKNYKILTQKIKADEAIGNKSKLNQQPLYNNSIAFQNKNVKLRKVLMNA